MCPVARVALTGNREKKGGRGKRSRLEERTRTVVQEREGEVEEREEDGAKRG